MRSAREQGSKGERLREVDERKKGEKEETERTGGSCNICTHTMRGGIESLRFGMRRGATDTRRPYSDWKLRRSGVTPKPGNRRTEKDTGSRKSGTFSK